MKNNTNIEDTIENAKKEFPFLYSANELINLPLEEVPYLWEPYLQKQQIAVLAGPSDVGKSTLVRQLALAICNGDDSFLNHNLHAEHRRILYCAMEDNPTSTKFTLVKQGDEMEFSENMLFIFDEDDIMANINKVISKWDIDLLIVDPFTDLFDGNLNDIINVRKFLKPFYKLANKHGFSIILLHHIGKGKENTAPNKNNLIGSQSIEGKVRLVMELRNSGANRRELWFTKGNSLPDDIKKNALSLEFKDLKFSYEGEVPLRLASHNNSPVRRSKYDYNKKEMVTRILELKESGLSFDKVRETLCIDFPDTCPSSGTIKAWYKEIRENAG